MKTNRLPSKFKQYFWDTDFKLLGLSENATYIVKRILDRGNTNDLYWLNENYEKNFIVKTILQTKDISKKTANFWADYLNLDRKKVLCLQKPYYPIHFGLSS